MRIKNKLKYYNELKNSEFSKVLKEHILKISNRQKIIFYTVLKKDMTDEQQKVLLKDLGLNLNIVEEYNKDLEEFRFVLVGNIIDKHYYGENKEMRRGTKHFRPGAKVYLLPEYGGNGHTDIPVYGLPRRSKRKIYIVVRGHMIKNIRVKKTFDPKLIAMIDDNFFYDYFDNDEAGLQGFADSINEYNMNNNIEVVDGINNSGSNI